VVFDNVRVNKQDAMLDKEGSGFMMAQVCS